MMDYKKIVDVLTEKLGKEKLGWIIVEKRCPHSFDLSDVKECGTYPQICRRCWAKALGLDEAGE